MIIIYTIYYLHRKERNRILQIYILYTVLHWIKQVDLLISKCTLYTQILYNYIYIYIQHAYTNIIYIPHMIMIVIRIRNIDQIKVKLVLILSTTNHYNDKCNVM